MRMVTLASPCMLMQTGGKENESRDGRGGWEREQGCTCCAGDARRNTCPLDGGARPEGGEGWGGGVSDEEVEWRGGEGGGGKGTWVCVMKPLIADVIVSCL